MKRSEETTARPVFVAGAAQRAGAALTEPRARFAEWFGARAPRRLDRLSELSVWLAAEALLDADLSLQPATGDAAERAGVFFATGYGNLAGTFAYLEKLHDKGQRFCSPIDFPNLVLSAPTGTLSIQFGYKGELLAYNDGELSGVHALIAGYDAIAAGRLDIALVVGADELSPARQVCAARRRAHAR